MIEHETYEMLGIFRKFMDPKDTLKDLDPSKLIDAVAYQKQQYQEKNVLLLESLVLPEEVSQKIETVNSTIDALQEIADQLKNTYEKLKADYEHIEAEYERRVSENGENSNCLDSSDKTGTEWYEKS